MSKYTTIAQIKADIKLSYAKILDYIRYKRVSGSDQPLRRRRTEFVSVLSGKSGWVCGSEKNLD